jgi:class 3 adenylate cyclase/tetratricopeptide (TPR) repeat protein
VDEQEVRRVVTVVTSDLKGSTSLGEKLDPESLREVLTRYFDEMRHVLEAHGGTIEKIIGDAIVAVFGLPVARAEDPFRAVRAAEATQRSLTELNEQLDRTWGVRLTARTGVATGDVVVGEASLGQHVLTGPVLQLATAMEQNAPANEILVAESTFALVRDAIVVEAVEPFVPKGQATPVPAYRLTGIREGAGRDALGPDRICPACGATNVPDARACMTCGANLQVGSAARESRKTVTIVFADPKPITETGAPPTPEALRDVMSRYFESMRSVLEGHGGTVEKFIGDAVMAVFGLPNRHEDDALRAARAALDMQAALPPLNETFSVEWGITLRNHIGVNTGEVVAGDASLGQRLVTGDAVNVAARLEQAAAPLEVLIGELTYRLVRDAADVEPVEPLILKGKAEPVPAYRLLTVRTGEAAARRQDAPMVGRDEEFALLTRTLTEVIDARVARSVTIIGDAGVGKTRLTSEFLARAGAVATVMRGRCLPYGDGITFWPMIEVVRSAVEIRDDDPTEMAMAKLVEAVGGDGEVADRVGSVMGLSATSYQVAELFWGIRRFFELIGSGPIVVLFDDIHWAEPTFLDVINHLLEGTETQLLILCTARHELLETRTDWGDGPGAARIVLQPLSDTDASRVIEHLLGDAGLADDARQRIVTASEGNPLFVEQLLSMLIDNGRLLRRDDRWVATSDLADLAIPPSIHALLAARLDALPAEERAVVDPASVIGLSFAQEAVEALVAEAVQHNVPIHLDGLTRKQLVRPQEDEETDDAIYRFHHLLVRDAAYQGLLKRSRAQLHERFVAWADVVNAERGRGTEFEEILGYHLEQAYRYRTELGPLDDHGRDLGVRAAERLGSAGQRALGRGDMPAAASLLGRAAAALPVDHRDRPWLLIRAGEARFEMGEFPAAGALFDQAVGAADIAAEPAVAATARIERLRLTYLTSAGAGDPHLARHVQETLPLLEESKEEGGLARAWRLLTYIEMAAASWGAAEQTATAMLEHARRSGDLLMEIRGLPALANTARVGPLPVPQALERCVDLVARAEGDRRAEALIQRAIAHLSAMRGDADFARSTYRRVRSTLLDLGWNFDAALVSHDSGPIEMLAGDDVAAEAELRDDFQTLNRMEERNYITTTAAYLAEALYRQGKYDEASSFVTFSETTAAEDDLLTQFLWRGVRAKLLARDGQIDDAITIGREAVRLARISDDPIGQGNALVDLAQTLRIARRDDEAEAVFAEALIAFDRKGSTASATVARGLFEGAVAYARGTGRIGYTPTTTGARGSNESS